VNLVFLHGPPATGKLTIGRELATLTGYRLFHNHLVVDALLAVYDFGSPGFVELREQIWRAVFLRAAQDGPPGLIFTFNAEITVRQDFIDWLFTALPSAGVKIFSVSLTDSEAEIERRLAATTRREFRKLTDAALYRRLRDQGAFNSPVIPAPDLTIDTNHATPAESAGLIFRALGPG
jgi:predicted kinase